MFLQASVILLTGGLTRPPRPGTPPDQAHHPPDQVHHQPWTRHTPQTRYTTPPRTRHTPPQTRHTTPPDQVHHPPRPGTPNPPNQVPPPPTDAGRYGQHAGSKHPTGMQSCYANSSCNSSCLKNRRCELTFKRSLGMSPRFLIALIFNIMAVGLGFFFQIL